MPLTVRSDSIRNLNVCLMVVLPEQVRNAIRSFWYNEKAALAKVTSAIALMLVQATNGAIRPNA